MDFKEVIETTLDQCLKNVVPLIVMTLVLMGVSAISLGFLAPVMMAGYTKSILDMVRLQRQPKPKDVFSKMGLFIPLSIFSLVIVMAVVIGLFFLVVPGLIIALAATYFLVYMIPLMVDKELGLLDAAKKSIELVRQSPLVDHIIIIVIFSVVQFIGGSTIIGTIATIPLSTVFLINTYEKVVN